VVVGNWTNCQATVHRNTRQHHGCYLGRKGGPNPFGEFFSNFLGNFSILGFWWWWLCFWRCFGGFFGGGGGDACFLALFGSWVLLRP